MYNGRLRHCPVHATIRRMKNPCRRPAGAEPDILLPVGRNTCPAGRESAFVRQGDRHAPDRHWCPRRAIAGGDERELAVNGIAQSDPMFAVPESKTIIERFGIFVGKLELPDLAAVSRLIYPRLLSRPDAQYKRRVPIKGLYIAKVQRLGSNDFQPFPCRSSVDGPQHRPFGPTGPCHLV